MDLSSLIASDDVTMEIKNDAKEPMVNDAGQKMIITFHGIDSEGHIAARNASINRVKKATARGRTMTAEEDVELTVDFLVALTKGWSGLQESGVALEYSTNNARRIYIKIPALREQADDFTAALGLRANFSKAASKS